MPTLGKLQNQRTFRLAAPLQTSGRERVKRPELLRQCRAAWATDPAGTTLIPDTDALHFTLTGPPGSGKNELVYQLAEDLGAPLFVIQGHEELTPEDLALTLVPSSAEDSKSHLLAIIVVQFLRQNSDCLKYYSDSSRALEAPNAFPASLDQNKP